jgi:hypothetical protein
MRILCLLMVLAVAGVTSLGGCDGDDGGAGSLLAQGTVTVPASGSVDVATVQATAPGTLQARITWSGAPTELAGVFKHVASGTIHGLTQSPSPLVSSAAVTSANVAAGADWLFTAGGTGGTAVSVQYEIRFIPD